MWDIGLGDVIFIILVLGVIHGIMLLINLFRKSRSKPPGDSGSE